MKTHIAGHQHQAACKTQLGKTMNGLHTVSVQEFATVPQAERCTRCGKRYETLKRMSDSKTSPVKTRREEVKEMWAKCNAETKARMDKRLGR